MRLAAMARDLMDASLLETRRMQMSLAPLDLGQLVRNIAERDPRIAERAKIHIAVDGPLLVNGDPQRLEQVVTNLLSNAMKYSAPATDIEIDVRACNGDVRVSVANRGPAIPADELPFLFARYVRSRSVRTSVTEGAGLGLYIAKGLVEAHGGRIWAESGADDVTTFRFTIPLVGRVPASADADVRPSPPALTEVRR
jgi:signal transduction histidine kinase